MLYIVTVPGMSLALLRRVGDVMVAESQRPSAAPHSHGEYPAAPGAGARRGGHGDVMPVARRARRGDPPQHGERAGTSAVPGGRRARSAPAASPSVPVAPAVSAGRTSRIGRWHQPFQSYQYDRRGFPVDNRLGLLGRPGSMAL
ncbi:hypothetical protein GCM10018787_11930 [Streptomyces thermodiastaticus]|nr:hypothetical protein GCM10018787_11930 [Streptomyces thermodiastaticus]